LTQPKKETEIVGTTQNITKNLQTNADSSTFIRQSTGENRDRSNGKVLSEWDSTNRFHSQNIAVQGSSGESRKRGLLDMQNDCEYQQESEIKKSWEHVVVPPVKKIKTVRATASVQKNNSTIHNTHIHNTNPGTNPCLALFV